MNLYVTSAELKTYLGISSSTHDTVLAMLNKFATDDLNGILSVSDLALHKVTDEIHDGGVDELDLFDLNVQEIGTIMEDTTEYTQDDAYDIDNYILHLDDGLLGGEREITVDYVAGWNAGGYATITITNYALITPLMTITIALGGSGGVVLTEGTNWYDDTSNEAVAISIAAAINANATLSADGGVSAFTIGAKVYIADRTAQRAITTCVLSATTGMTLSGSPLAGVNFPEGLRNAVMLLVAGRFAKRKNARVKNYTIGTKSVSFGSDEDASEFSRIVSQYKRAKVFVL